MKKSIMELMNYRDGIPMQDQVFARCGDVGYTAEVCVAAIESGFMDDKHI